MNGSVIAGVAILLGVILVASPARAQEDDRVPGEAVEAADTSGSPVSIDVSALDEQLPASGDDDEIEREGTGFRNDSRSQRWSVGWRIRVSGVLQEPAGYRGGLYAGNRFRVYQRFGVRKGDAFSLGLLTEKDPGEAGLADFVSGVASVGNLPGGTRLVAGDFRLQAGQGLLFGSPRSYGKGAAAIEPVLREGRGVREGLSSDEVNHFRGIAAAGGHGPVSFALFGSWKKLSPRLSAEGELTGIDLTGYHRTASELARQGLLTDRSFGGTIALRAARWLTVGVNGLRSVYSTGNGNDGTPASGPVTSRRMSFDLRIGFPVLTVFGEVVAVGGEVPWIAGTLVVPSERARFVLLRRMYPAVSDFRRTFGFADGSTGRNESGTYLGAEMTLHPGIVAAGYLDLVSSPAPDRGTVFPASGVDRLISVRIAPSRRVRVETVFRSRAIEATAEAAAGAPLPTPTNGVKRVERVRCELGWSPTERLSCRFRVEYSSASPGSRGKTGNGSMFFADLTVEPARGFTLHSRLLFFDTESFASGIYTAEADLPGTITGTLLNGEGTRWYLVSAWRLSKELRLAVKYSSYRRDDLRKIGSGADEMPSNIVEKAGFQLDFSF